MMTFFSLSLSVSIETRQLSVLDMPLFPVSVSGVSSPPRSPPVQIFTGAGHACSNAFWCFFGRITPPPSFGKLIVSSVFVELDQRWGIWRLRKIPVWWRGHQGVSELVAFAIVLYIQGRGACSTRKSRLHSRGYLGYRPVVE